MADARDDIQDILTNTDEFANPVIFTPPGGQPVTVNGLCIKHNLKFDEFGNAVSSKTERTTISEPALIAAGYTVRNAANEVALIGHKITWTDVMNITWSYIIAQNIAGETNGIIVLTLKDL